MESGFPEIKGLTGQVKDIRAAVPAAESVGPAGEGRGADINLKRMAEWAMNYLIRTPRPEYGYEPVFQCHPLRCPPVPERRDVVVPCDTDARLEWEWYYMRDISGSDRGRDVEKAYHERMRGYIDADGLVWSHAGCYNEGDIDKVYGKEDNVIHIWGATKILKSLSEDYARTHDETSHELAGKVMRALKRLAIWGGPDKCWFAGGMGALKTDGTPVANNWNSQPAPIVEPLVTYWEVTGDREGLDFAKAYANGIISGAQPGGMRFGPDGTNSGHSHATMHAIWGIAHLGVILDDAKYVEFAKRAWDRLLERGTGTGWFPAGPDNCNETCCISDMISIATLVGQWGLTEYFDYAERYVRNYISNLQFIVTPEFELYYRNLHKDKPMGDVDAGLAELRKFQGGIVGGSGINDYENVLLGGGSGFEMFGCCAPEGMRAIWTAWSNTIFALPESRLGPAGIYVNMGFPRDSKLGRVITFMPNEGRLSVVASAPGAYFIRPPHWAAQGAVRAFRNCRGIGAEWSGAYVRIDAERAGDELTITYPLLSFKHSVSGLWNAQAKKPDLKFDFEWLGNMVVSVDPPAELTPLFTGRPRILPEAPI